MKLISYKYLAFLFVLFITGCSEDVLEIDSIGRFSSGDYLTTEDEAEQAIIGVYDFLAVGYNNYNDWSSIFFAKVLPGDFSNAGGGSSTDQNKLQKLDNFGLGYDNVAIKDVWRSFYRIISSSNAIINNITDGLDNSERIVAEAKFFRAYAYFELVTMWGEVPFYTENPTETSVALPRISVATIYAAIEKDLSDASSELDLKSDLLDGEKFRISKGTAQSLLGKVYLYQEKYALAHQIFDEVISSGEYSLVADYGTIWLKGERAGSESIFEVLYCSQNQHDWGGPWDGTAESNFVAQLMGPRGDNSFNNLDKIGYVNGWGFNVPTKEIGDLLNAKAGAERAIASVISEEDFLAAGGEVNGPGSASPGNFNWGAYEGYIRLKYSTIPTETAGPVNEVNWHTPFKLIRYADVLLMAAEAYTKDSQDADAVALIKEVRERAGLLDHSSWEGLTGDDLFEFIVEERSLELAFEGHRFWDLVRWGKASSELADTDFQSGKNELYPIPKSEIDLNPGISNADQNPGY